MISVKLFAPLLFILSLSRCSADSTSDCCDLLDAASQGLAHPATATAEVAYMETVNVVFDSSGYRTTTVGVSTSEASSGGPTDITISTVTRQATAYTLVSYIAVQFDFDSTDFRSMMKRTITKDIAQFSGTLPSGEDITIHTEYSTVATSLAEPFWCARDQITAEVQPITDSAVCSVLTCPESAVASATATWASGTFHMTRDPSYASAKTLEEVSAVTNACVCPSPVDGSTVTRPVCPPMTSDSATDT